jgi:hypothetical protein
MTAIVPSNTTDGSRTRTPFAEVNNRQSPSARNQGTGAEGEIAACLNAYLNARSKLGKAHGLCP